MQIPRLEGWLLDNPLLKGVLAGTIAATALASTTAFAPIGVVGATGWTVVYLVTATTVAIETRSMRERWRSR
jgi:hypothetical protein